MSVTVTVEIDPDEFAKAADRLQVDIEAANGRAAAALGRRAIRLFRSTVRTWRNKPQFDLETNASANAIEVLVGTDDKIYGYIDRGTSVRYAIMSRDFAAKTTPGSLQSRPGRGGAVFISRQHPRPGIKARDFSGNIAKTLDREAEAIFNQEIKKVR